MIKLQTVKRPGWLMIYKNSANTQRRQGSGSKRVGVPGCGKVPSDPDPRTTFHQFAVMEPA
jgi:hypothetical protein